VLSYVKSHSGHEYPRNSYLMKNAVAINRLFRFSSLEEITDALKREEADGSKFASACLKRMQANSELSMKLSLRMIREAKNLDFKGALKNEVNVSLNKIMDKEFDLGVSEVLLKPNSQGTKDPVNPGFASNISAEQVNSYF